MKVGDLVRIQKTPANPDPDVDYSSYEEYIGEITEINNGIATLYVPEKMMMQHKIPVDFAPLIQLKLVSKEEAAQQLAEAAEAEKKIWN